MCAMGPKADGTATLEQRRRQIGDHLLRRGLLPLGTDVRYLCASAASAVPVQVQPAFVAHRMLAVRGALPLVCMHCAAAYGASWGYAVYRQTDPALASQLSRVRGSCEPLAMGQYQPCIPHQLVGLTQGLPHGPNEPMSQRY
jgi:hypothetical protein